MMRAKPVLGVGRGEACDSWRGPAPASAFNATGQDVRFTFPAGDCPTSCSSLPGLDRRFRPKSAIGGGPAVLALGIPLDEIARGAAKLAHRRGPDGAFGPKKAPAANGASVFVIMPTPTRSPPRAAPAPHVLGRPGSWLFGAGPGDRRCGQERTP